MDHPEGRRNSRRRKDFLCDLCGSSFRSSQLEAIEREGFAKIARKK
jgi:hypothetical protein